MLPKQNDVLMVLCIDKTLEVKNAGQDGARYYLRSVRLSPCLGLPSDLTLQTLPTILWAI